MHKNFIYLLFLLISFSAVAQVQITGKVTDKATKLPIEFADIILTHKPSQRLTGGITDEQGNFKLVVSTGTYTLQVSYVGQILYESELNIEENVALGILEVENSQELEEVTITGRKKLIQQKIDRLVFNVENSTKSSQGDALEVLRVTPGIRVQNDKITMIGKNDVRVMINDKIVPMSNEDLASFLKSIASEDIKNIEVITTPPAKYEASGNSGLVNITLKEAKKNSWNALLKSSFTQRKYGGITYGGNFNYSKNRFSIASSFNVRDIGYYQEQDDYAYFPDGIWYTSSPFKMDLNTANARIDLNYEITPKWSMGAQYLYNDRGYISTDAPYNPVFDYETNDITRTLQSEGRIDLKDQHLHSFNYNNEVAVDTMGRKIILNLDYFTYRKFDVKTYDGFSIIENPFLQQYYAGINTNDHRITNTSANLDIEYPTAWANLSFGGRISNLKSLNDITLFNSGLVDDPVVDLPVDDNDFEYTEAVQALYFSADKKINDKWSTQLGLRVEVTQANSISGSFGIDNKWEYTKLFPTFYLSYNATEDATFTFNYSRRIERPQFWQLNPNAYFSNPFQSVEGNPFLQPAFIDNVEFTHTYKNFVTKVYYSFEDNWFAQIPIPDSATNNIRYTYENYVDTQRFGISENYIFDKLNWWSSNNSFDLNYSSSIFNLPEEQEKQTGFNARISTYNDFDLNPDKTLVLGVNYWYGFPGINGIFNTKPLSSLSLSLQWLLLNKDLNLTFRANDIFRSEIDSVTSTISGVYQTGRYYYDTQFVQLSVSYRFGNNDIKSKQHKTGNENEKDRT